MQTHTLAHAARQLARIGGFVSVKPDEIDGGEGARRISDCGSRSASKPELDVFQHRHPRKKREVLKHHRDARSGLNDLLPEIA